MFKLGLVVNPLAGIGGPLALKGSDGAAIVSEALARGAELRASQRSSVALQMLPASASLKIYCFGGAMGADAASSAGLPCEVIGEPEQPSTANDTRAAAKALSQLGVDLLLFSGGDGTARDIYEAVGDRFAVLGIPAGVKMHSGVFAVSPQAAGELVLRLLAGKLVDIGPAEVRDIDEQAFRQGQVKTRFYGELLVPREGHFLQQVKSSGREVEALVVQDIAADVIESMDDECLYFIGPGTTPSGIMEQLGLDNTLLGIDAVQRGELLGKDLDEQSLRALLDAHSGPAQIVITAIGGQGHILGRGNQQLSPVVIRAVGVDNITIVASKTKLTALQGRPLLVDSNEPELDQQLSGYRPVITGYHDAVMYPVGFQPGGEEGDEECSEEGAE